jgi:hypothetical protein
MCEELTELIKEKRKRDFSSSYNLFDLIPNITGDNYMLTIRKTIQSLLGLIMISNGEHETFHNKLKQQKLFLDLRRFLWV